MDAVTHLAPAVGVVAACDSLGVARASFYRQRPIFGPSASPAPEPALPAERSAPARSLSPAERAGVLAVLHEERFQDRSPAAVQATLLDEGQYLCSVRTMYRILQQEGESGERRDQLVHPAYQKPELLATGAQPTLELGHHQAARSGQVDLLLSVRHPRRLQPLRHRLDGRDSGKCRTGQAIHRGGHRQAPGSRRPTHHPRRPRPGHEVQAGGLSDGRPGCHQDATADLMFPTTTRIRKASSEP